MENELEALLATLTPEELQQLMGLGTNDERSGIVQQQLAQADALRNSQMGDYGTPGGAAMGGISSVLDKVRGGMEAKDLQGQQQGLLGQKDAGRMTYLDALRRQQQGPALPPKNITVDIPGAF